MSDGDLGGQTLTVVRRGAVTGEDGYGKPTYGPDVEIPISGCDVQPMLSRLVSQEDMQATQDVVVSRWRFFAPPDADIKANDRARCNIVAADLQVDGDPMVWPDEDGDPHHIEGYLRKWTG